MELISQAAEAKIYRNKNIVIKERVKKGYRITQIDRRLRKQRTTREVKILQILREICPEILNHKENTIEMEYLDGDILKQLLDKNPDLAKSAGEITAKIHSKGIIHGDLTTSNMIFHKNKLYLIDFGLSFFSDKIEDQAVDIHLFKQALMSRHHEVYDRAYKYFLEGYKSYKNHKKVIARLDEVEKRGRYKGKNY